MNSNIKLVLMILLIPQFAVFYLGAIWLVVEITFQVLSFVGVSERIAQLLSGIFTLISAAFVSAVLLVWAEENVK